MEDLLLEIKKSGIRIDVKEANLKLQIPKDFYNEALMANIKKNKAALIDYVENSKSKNSKLKEIPKAECEFSRLTPSQLRIFLAEGVTKGTTAYNVSFGYELIGKLDIQQLEKAFIQLIQRHEGLRTYFELDENYEPVQKIQQDFYFGLDCSICTEEDLENAKREFSTSFDLDQAPLIRAKVLELNSNRFILLVDIHHIVFDGFSMKIFMTELFAAYNNEKLPEIKLNYVDYATWFNGDGYKDQLEAQKEFWLKHLDGYSNTSSLPSDSKKSDKPSFEGSVSEFHITKSRKAGLKKLTTKHHVSLFTLLTSIYGLLEAKLTGVNDLAIGTPVAGRRHWSVENIIGMFVNTLAIRMKPDVKLSFNDYLLQVRDSVLHSFDNQEYPYETLYDDLGITNSTQNNSLFNSLITLVNFAENVTFQMGEMEARPLELFKSKSKFDLSMYFIEKSDEIACYFEYNTQLFQKDTIEQFFNYFVNIVDQITEDDTICLGEISLLDAISARELIELNDFNHVDFPNDVTLVDLFERQAEQSPDSIALVFGERTKTYEEINQSANKVARMLQAKGVGRNDAVGLLMEKNLEVVISMLGILKAGGVYVPIDVTYPQDRIDYITENSQLKWMLTADAYAGLVQNSAVEIVTMEEAEAISDATNLPGINRPEDLCYVIYTSGTTGQPKGVMVEHKNLVRLLFNEAFQFDFSAEDVWTMFHSHCFDFSVWEMYGALLYGGKLVIVSQDEARDPSRYLEIIQDNQVTVLNQTPTAFYSLNKVCEDRGVELPGIRYVIFGGEALAPIKLKRWSALHPQTKLVNMYGITEITVHATYKEIGSNEIENDLGSIGKSLPTGSLYLLDSSMNHVPVGVMGELYVGGEGVARGYMNNEELTNSRFVANPFENEARLYRTGDLAVQLPNGDFEYKGRIDRQVQLKGFRIELKEIESHLMQYEFIQDVVVNMTQPENGAPYLCAYYIGTKKLEVAELRAYLERKVPHYMVPAYFVKLEEIPFTSNNKIDFDKLPKPTIGLSDSTYQAPKTAEETQMCEIWQKFLEIDQIGLSDNFFSLGGDSLKAIGLVARINEHFSSKLIIADIYAKPTVQELVDEIETNGDQVLENLRKEVEEELDQFQENYKKNNEFPDTYEAVYPMSGIEKGMVYHTIRMKPESAEEIVYHEQNMYAFPVDNFNFDIFEDALNLLVERYEEFRKIYDINNLAHIILKEIKPDLTFIDISHLNDAEQNAFITKKCEEEKLRQTELSMSVIWRMHIIKTRENYQYLLFDFHHSLIDGWSLSVFLRELNNTYYNLVKNSAYLPKTIQGGYRDQILAELVSCNDERSIAYWRTTLEDYKRFELLPTGKPNKIITNNYDLGTGLRKELEVVADQLGVSFKHFCYAGLLYALKRLTYENDLTIGVVSNTRPLISDGEELVGCFLNTVPFRVEIAEGSTWKDYIKTVDSGLVELKYHEFVPFYKILEFIDEKTNHENPIFDVKLNYIDFRAYNEFENEKDDFMEELSGDSKAYLNENTPLNLTIVAPNDDFILNLIYSTAFLEDDASEKLFQYIKHTFEQVIKDVNGKHGGDNILPKEEYLKVTEAFNNTSTAYEENTTVLDLFNEQVIAAPEHLAVTYENSSLTYRELDEVSNQLANKLVEMGVKSETLVPISVDRSIEMIVGILAILKAGGAYVPIDPTYADNRINYILEDIASALILTQSKYEGKFNMSTLFLDDAFAYSEYDKTAPEVQVVDSSLIYTFYTSGTTGKPKGVMNTHAGVYNNLVWMKNHYEITSEDNFLQKTNFCFDVSVWELLLPVISGSRIVFAKPEGHRDSKYIESLIDEEQITFTHFVPSMLSLFLMDIDNLNAETLRGIFVIGEELKLSTVRDFKEKLPNVQLHNLYGPTEAAIAVTAIYLSAYEGNIVPIGTPIANTQIYIVNNQNEVQPVGVKGELLIGGIQVAKGYLNKETLTSKKFIADTIDPDSGYRLYKTGDFARWLPDGTLEFLGRIDNQIKLRGNRIELGEIEYNLSTHEAIETATVLLREYNETPSIVAYCLTKQDEPFSIDALKDHLRAYVPEYMIPAYFVRLKELPLSSNGKLDIRLLPDPERVATTEFVAPSNETEAQIATIWEEVLQREQVGVNDDFFQIGGNSILLMKVSSLVTKKLSVELSIGELFQNPSVKLIAALVQEKLLTKSQDNEGTAGKDARLHIYEALKFQTWRFLDYKSNKIFPNNLFLENTFVDVDFDIITNVVDTLVDRHESLRTLFYKRKDKVFQRVYDKNTYRPNVTFEDISQESNVEERLESIKGEMKDYLFDYEKEQSFICKLIKFSEHQFQFIFSVDHIIADAYSKRIIVQELWTIYNAYSNGLENPLPPLELQMIDYTRYHHQHYKGDLLESHETYFTNLFEQLPPKLRIDSTKIPGPPANNKPKPQLKTRAELMALTKKKGSPVVEGEERGYYFTIPSHLEDRITELSADWKVSNHSILLASFSLLLDRISDQNEFFIDTPMSTRHNEDFSKIVGWLIGGLISRIKVNNALSFQDLVMHCRQRLVEGLDHIHFSTYSDLLEEEWNDVVSTHLNILGENPEIPVPEFDSPHFEVCGLVFDLTFNIEFYQNGILVNCLYNTGLVGESEISYLCDYYNDLLEGLLNHPTVKMNKWK